MLKIPSPGVLYIIRAIDHWVVYRVRLLLEKVNDRGATAARKLRWSNYDRWGIFDWSDFNTKVHEFGEVVNKFYWLEVGWPILLSVRSVPYLGFIP